MARRRDRRQKRTASPRAARRGLVLEELEPRLLMSALSPAEAEAAAALAQPAFETAIEQRTDDPSALADGPGAAAATLTEPIAEIAFIDSRVPDRAALIADLRQQADAGRNIELIEIGADADGLALISSTLSSRNEIGALHILSHGGDGVLLLGARVVDADALANHAEALSGWATSLTSDADILLYGCDVAASESGRTLVDQLARLTGADVAASDDTTGAAERGGDWQLEVRTGAVEAQAPISASLQQTWQAELATFVVTNTNNSGAGSLRQAILNANASGGTDLISFNIPTSDPGYRDPTPGAPGSGDEYWRIVPTSSFALITGPVILDATTQPGYDPGSGRPVIEIDGSLATDATALFDMETSDSMVRGFALHSGADEALEITAGSNNTIQGNWIGLDAEGNVRGNTENGILLDVGASGNLIGGAGLNQGNIIAGNARSGVLIKDAGTNGNIIRGNRIGVLPDGSTAAANGRHGIEISTAVAGTIVGGTGVGEGNLIRSNARDGVAVNSDAGANNAILGNRILANAGLGIDLGDDGVTANDALDADGGPNALQNFPVLTSAHAVGGDVTISGTLHGAAGTSFRIEFFSSPTGDASGHGEGQTYLGAVVVTTNGLGNAAFSTTLSGVSVAIGDRVSATATVSLGGGSYGSTSEFAAHIAATNPVPSIDLDANDSSGATGSGYAATWTEGSPVAVADSDALVTDPDSANLVMATVTITNPLDGAAELLTANTAGTAITASYAPATGVLTLSGADTVAHFQQVLRTVRYDNTSDLPNPDTRVIQFQVSDGVFNSNIATTQVSMLPVNDPPAAVSDIGAVLEGGATTIDVAANDSDPDNALDLTSLQIVSGPANGSVVVNGDGTITYTHDGSETTSDSFTYTIRDAAGAVSNVANVSLTVTPVNDAPVASADAATVAEGGSTTLDLAANDSDPDNALDLTSIQIVSGPANGSVVVNGDGTVTYTHDGSETAADSLTYTVRDAAGAISNVATVSLTVTPVNDAPVAVNDSATLGEGTSASIDVAANDIDAEGALDLSSIQIVSGPANGSVVVNGDGTISYTHDSSETSSDSFTCTLRDASGLISNLSVVSLTISPVNDAPAFGSNQIAIAAGGTLVLSAAELSATDVDDAVAGLTFTVSGVVAGRFELASLPGSPVTAFDQAQLLAGEVRFIHDGSAVMPAYQVIVSDGLANVGPLAAQVQFTGPTDVALFLPGEDPVDVPPEVADDGPSPGAVEATPLHPGEGPLALDAGVDAPLRGSFSVPEVLAGYAQRTPGILEAASPDFSWAGLRARERDSVEIQSDVMGMRESLLASLDQLRRDLSAHQGHADESGWRRASIEAVSLAFSAGFIAAALRTSSLWAAMLSLVPLWQRVDPLVVLAVSGEERRRRREEIRRAEERRSKVGGVLDRPSQ